MGTNNLYTTKTAALKATKADISKLDAKKLLLNGKNILDYISESGFDSYDTRDPQLKNDELDIWNTAISLSDNGHIEVKPFEHNYDYLSNTGKLDITRGSSCVHVIDNEILDANNEHVMYWQTDGFTSSNYSQVFYDYIKTFSSDLSSLTNGSMMFEYCSNITTFISDLSNMTDGRWMFEYCSNITTFNSDLSKMTEGKQMFANCTNLTTFKSNLSSLTSGESMFLNCFALPSFNIALPSLTYGYCMFQKCYDLESFSSDLPSLTYGEEMFFDCDNLTSFSSDLPSLTDGYIMFADCSKLTSFNSDLSSLTGGWSMFYNCKLDAPSVANIIHFIPQRDTKPTSSDSRDGNICIGIGITNTDAAKQAFAEECDCDTWEELNKEFDDKNWGVQWQFNGPASYSLRDPRPSTAVYTKLEEVFMPTEEEIAAAKEKGEHIEIPRYQYTSQDGDNYYNIHWYHDSNTNNEGYDYFESLEMATLAYSVIPKA